MRTILLGLLLISAVAYGQIPEWQVSFQLQPELTFHKHSYTTSKDHSGKTTFNTGVSSTIQHNLSNGFFVNAGLGFVSRSLRTASVLNQVALPPSDISPTNEIVTTESVAHRILFFPVTAGYRFLRKARLSSYVTTGFTGNYLLSSKYQSDLSRYDGTYKKNYWQGYSVNAGLGADYKLSEKIYTTVAFAYSVINSVTKDEFIQQPYGSNVRLTYNYLNFNLGVKLPL